MKFLLDENVTMSIKNFLKSKRYEVETLKDLKKLGIENGEVAKIAIQNQEIIITFDSDFLSLKKTLKKDLRIILIKMHHINPKVAVSLLDTHFDFCIKKLVNPGQVIITEMDCRYQQNI